MVLLLLIDSAKLEIILDKIIFKILRYNPNITPPMIKNTYSSHLNSTATLLPDPRIIMFLKQYSQSLEVLKGKKKPYIVGKN